MGTAQNKLGELFVDIGVGGLGKTLKGLNSVSASFLLAKNAAVQMTKPIVDMTKQFGNNAVGVRKMTVAFKGMTDDMSQRIQALSKIKNLNNLIPALTKIQQEFSNFATGMPVDPNFSRGLFELGKDIKDYTNDVDGYLSVLSDLQNKINTMDFSEANAIFGKYLSGIDLDELRWATSERIDYKNIPALANALTESEINKAIKGQEDLNKLQLTVFQALEKIFVNNSDKIVAIINKFSGAAEKLPELIDENKDLIKNAAVVGGVALTAGTVSKIGASSGAAAGVATGAGKNALKVVKNPWVQLITLGALYAKEMEKYIEKGILPTTPYGSTYYNPNKTKTGNGQIEYLPELDIKGKSNISDIPTNNISAINFNIYSDNAEEISNKVNNNLNEVLNSSRYYQTIV